MATWLEPAKLDAIISGITEGINMDKTVEAWQNWKRSGEGKRLQMVIFGLIMRNFGEQVNVVWIEREAQDIGITPSRTKDALKALEEIRFITKGTSPQGRRTYVKPTLMAMERWGEREAAVGVR